jgi:RNase P subunit RPR2
MQFKSETHYCKTLIWITKPFHILASRSHQHKVKVTCSVCNHAHSIPHPPESTTSPDLPNTSRQCQEEENSSKKKKIPFWKQPEHVTFADQKVVEGGI